MANNTFVDPIFCSVMANAIKMSKDGGDNQQQFPQMPSEIGAFWNAPQTQQPQQAPSIPQPPPMPPQLQEQLQQHITQRQMQQLLVLLQQQQQEIKEQQQKEKVTNNVIFHTFIGAREVELLIREFNPSKNSELHACEWIREIEHLGKIYKWDPCLLMLYSSMRLGGVAKVWHEYSLQLINNWDDFKRELISNFPRSVDSADVLSQLIARKRQSNESIEEYYHSIVRMARKIKLPDDTIKEYLIRGLDQSKDQIVLSSIGPCSLTEFLQHMQRLERETRKNTIVGFPIKPPAKLRSRSPEDRKRSRSISKDSSERNDRSDRKTDCSYSGSTKHYKSNYPTQFKINESKQEMKSNNPPGRPDRREDLHRDAKNYSRSGTKKDKWRPARPSTSTRGGIKARVCFCCRKEGHFISECPMQKSQMEAQGNRKVSEEKTKQDETHTHVAVESFDDKDDDDIRLEIDLSPDDMLEENEDI